MLPKVSCYLFFFILTVATYPNATFPCCFDMQIDSAGFVHALVYSLYCTTKIIVESFRFVLYAQHHHLNQAFLLRGMNVVINVQELESVWISGTDFWRDRMFSMPIC